MEDKCPKCGESFDPIGKWGRKKFCSRRCANGKVHSVETKQKISKSMTGKKLPEEVKQKLRGDKHPKRRGKSLPPVIYRKIECLQCQREVSTSSDTRKFCSTDCYMNYKKANRLAREQYELDSKFKFNIYDYPDEFDLSLIDQFGWYSAANKGNNIYGVSRDHMISISYGFENRIPAEIISHPANCQLMRHNLNSKKNISCSITVEELEQRIKFWNEKYHTKKIS
jgi:endogenous inhibitor of DNA gyrase (YacG/DUF329 family)